MKENIEVLNVERKKDAFYNLLKVIKRLRRDCPWDRKQTMESLRILTIEEVYELGDGILSQNMDDIKSELGDLLMHIVFYSEIGEENNSFDIADVLDAVCDKLIYRHPHIYGDVKVDDEEGVLQNWEKLKIKEGKVYRGVLSGVPSSLPAIVKAYRIQSKAKGVGFDWENKEDVWAKVKEELQEFEAEIKAMDNDKMEDEFGDIMFALINAARMYGINPEDALERTNRKFIRRFNAVEDMVKSMGINISEAGLEKLDKLWDEVKREEKR